MVRRYGEVPVEIDWAEGADPPAELEPLAQSVLAEAFRNVHKHAEPRKVEVGVGVADDTFSLQVVNDGVRESSLGTGMGLRLAQFEALQQGGVLEFGPAGRRRWRLRLVVPVEGA